MTSRKVRPNEVTRATRTRKCAEVRAGWEEAAPSVKTEQRGTARADPALVATPAAAGRTDNAQEQVARDSFAPNPIAEASAESDRGLLLASAAGESVPTMGKQSSAGSWAGLPVFVPSGRMAFTPGFRERASI